MPFDLKVARLRGIENYFTTICISFNQDTLRHTEDDVNGAKLQRLQVPNNVAWSLERNLLWHFTVLDFATVIIAILFL